MQINGISKGFLRNFLGVGLIKFSGIPITLITSILLARGLGPESFGEYSFVMALIPLLCIPMSAGLSPLLTREIATHVHNKNWGKYKGIIISSYLWVILMSLLIICTVFIVKEIAPTLFSSERWSLLLLSIFLIPVMGLNSIRNGVIKGLGLPFYSELPAELIQPLLSCFGLAALLFSSKLTGETAVTTQLVSFVITFFIATAIYLNVKPSVSAAATYSNTKWLQSLLPFSLIAIVSIFNNQIGIVLLGILGNSEDVAGLRVAERGAQFVGLSLIVVNLIISPSVVELYKNKDIEGLQKLAKSSTRIAFAISLPIAVGLIFFGRTIISFLYGEAYVEIAYLPLGILVFAQLINVGFGSVGILLSMSGYERSTLFGVIIGLLLNFFVSFALVPMLGAEGAALGGAVGLMTWNILLFLSVKEKLKINPFVI